MDSERQTHTLSVIECLETQAVNGQPQTTRFKWICNLQVKVKTVLRLTNEGGRLRWKIDAKREGFNVQKNGGFRLEQAYGENATAAKVFYLLLQIAHLLSQLVEHGSLFGRAFPKGVGSSKNIALRLLEAWRTLRLDSATLERLLAGRFQIRFDTS